MKKVVVRFAPSPTGFLHIGGLRTALFNWLWARKNKGKFILRIEDTDQGRLVEGAVDNIKEALQWYGLDFDEGPILQSERLELYKKYADELLEKGSAYQCFCSAERLAEVRKVQEVNKQATKYDGLCRSLSKEDVTQKIKAGDSHVLRLKVPQDGSTSFEDIVYGKITVANVNIDDQVLLKSDGWPTYHLANVVDDHDMAVTHVIRAEEWLPSTPKHIILYQMMDWPLPVFSHLPMVLGPDKTKLSKRHGAVAALEYKKLGYLPEAVLNFIALLGWNPKIEKEIFSIKELISEFDLSKVNKASAIFNIEKLDWMNGQYIKNLELDQLLNMSKNFLEIKKEDKLFFSKVVRLHQDRLKKIKEIVEIANHYLVASYKYDPKILVPKSGSPEETIIILGLIITKLKTVDQKDFDQDDRLKNIFEEFIQEKELTNKSVLWPLRVAITGLEKSPGVFEMMSALGKQKALQHLEEGLKKLQKG